MSNILPPSSKEEKALTNKEKHLSPKDDVILKVRWSLQDEIAKIFNPSIKDAFRRLPVSCTCSISTCPTEDGDYLCTNVVEAWPELRKTRRFLGPTEAGLTLRRNVMLMNTRSGMIERCVVCGPGFLTFKLSMKWITKSIHKMVRNGMDICAPKLSVERAILYFLSGNVAEKMHIGHLRSGVIGETLARILEYSRVEVIRKFHEEDVLELKMMMEFLIEMFPNGIVNDPSPRELEVWYMELKKRFDEDAEFRDRAQKLQSQVLEISKIRREQNQEVYVRLAVHVKEEVFNSNITETLDLPREIAAFWHALNRADWILHVTDVGQQDHCEICTSAAKRTGCIVNDGGAYPLRHVGFGPVQADDYLVNLLGEAKIRCKAVLLGQGKADEWTAEELDDTAEALGYDAVKYAVLKKNRLTKCTINFDEILNEKGNTVVYLHYTHAQVCSIITEYTEDIKRLKKLKGKKVEKLTLKNNEERELGLHLLRFTEVLGEICTLLMPHILCEYLYDLCKKFDSFYSCVSQVVGYGAQKTKLLLCEATAMVMRKCFHLLGITFDSRRLKLSRPGSKLSKRCYFSDLTEQQLMELFCKGPSFRFDLCKVFLRHIIDVGIANHSIYDKLFLCGVIQAETHISDGSLNILHRNFDNPLVITKPSFLSPHDICYSSLSVSTFVKITAKLYGTTYKGDGMESISEYRKYYPTLKCDSVKHRDYLKMFLETGTIFLTREKKKKKKEKVYIDDDVFHICDDNVIINFSEYFADRPNGGSGYSKLKGKDGYLDLYYVALKYAVEAALEVEFVATSKKTKVFGRVMAYYGKNFSYDCCASKRYFYNAILSETKQPSHIEPGKINLMRSALGVPAQYSLIIDAKLHDFTSGDMILSGVCEFFVPVDGSSSVGFINGSDCCLKLKVDWKLPF